MIEDVYEPLDRYKYEFEQKFAELASQKFEELSEESGVDANKNRETVSEARRLKFKLARASKKAGALSALICLLAIAAIAGVWLAATLDVLYIFIAAISLILLYPACRSRKECGGICSDLELEIKAKISEGYTQMQALNKLYTWDISARLIEKCVPRLEFDPYFTAARLEELTRVFDWDGNFNSDKSILFAQSGSINGNPFALGEYLRFYWGTKEYTGYKTIYWTAMERDANGRMRSVRRSQTLRASVLKPYPEYERKKVLIYGNEAAPNLSFSRRPSGLSTAGDGLSARLKKWWKLRELKSFSRNLSDDSDYTLMSNHEFETLFETKNRDNEVEYRLLFTPLAQRQMLKLLKDDKNGFGDDFTFAKRKKINLIFADHLDKTPIDTNPQRFKNWNYDEAKTDFMRFNLSYFRSVYFAFAPLLSIPLYQQTRTHEDIYGDISKARPSFWEHESIANYYGDSRFKNPLSATQNILKTKLLGSDGGMSKVEVTARGFRGVPRTEFKSVLGADMRMHSVPIEWVEYLPVENASTIYISESKEAAEAFKENRICEGELCRRGIYSFLG